MEGLKRILALASFEARLSRRMIRAWVLGILALFVPLGQTAQMLLIHRFGSGFNASFTGLTPDFIIMQPVFTLSALMGLLGVFYVFDWRHRDVSRHFAASLDASPLTRLQHAWGKYLGVVPVLLAPLVALLLVQVVVTLVAGISIPLQVYVNCYLAIGLPLALTPPALAFGIAGLLRNQAAGRALAILAGAGWLGLVFGGGFGLDEKHAVLLGISVDMPAWSDWVGYDWSALTLVQRAWSILLALLFTSLASLGPLGLPESPAERRRRVAIVSGLAVLVVAASALGGWMYRSGSAHARAVIDAEERAASEPRLTVTRREAEIDLSVKGRLDGVARLSLRNDHALPVTTAILRLNPGLEVVRAAVDGIAATASRDESVVRVPLNLAPGAEAIVTLEYGGKLDRVGADPRAVLHVRGSSAMIRNNTRLFGTSPAYLDDAIAVLTIDCGFLPDPALLQGIRHPDRAYPDVAPGRLAVRVPEGWTAAGTGRRTGASPDFEFVSEEPVSGLAACAGRFVETEVQAAGMTLRMLRHPDHGRNVEFFAPAKDLLIAEIEKEVAGIRSRTGLLPPPELSLVDVPQLLATYMGTWDGMNRQGQPGIVLVKEGSLFGARFEQPWKSAREAIAKAGGARPASASAPAEASAPAAAPGASAQPPSAPAAVPDASLVPATPAAPQDVTAPAITVPAATAPAATVAPGATPDPATAAAQSPAASGDAGTGVAGTAIAQAGPDHAATDPAAAGDPAQVKLDILKRFYAADFTGGAVPRLAMRSFWDARVRPAGPGLPILGPALSSFVSETALGAFHVESTETARILQGDATNRIVGATLGGRTQDIPDLVMNAVADPDDAYAYMVELPMEAMDPSKKPREWAGVLYMKGRRPLKALRELIGAEGFGTAIASLPGIEPLTWERFRQALLDAARPEDRPSAMVILDNWLSGTALPGFVVESVSTWRVQESPERWQVLATIRNDGGAAGLARLTAGTGRDAPGLLVDVPAGGRVEAGLLVPRKLDAWRLDPFLALNRVPPTGSIQAADAPPSPSGSPAAIVEGQREAAPATSPERIVVDNVDEGFTVMHEGLPRGHADRDDEGERILKTWSGWRQPGQWRRWRFDGRGSRPHGAFEETAMVKRGTEEGAEPATWRTRLEPGIWRVEAYLPAAENRRGPNPAPVHEFVVVHAGGEKTVRLTLDSQSGAWTDLGPHRFDGSAEIRLLDKGKGLIVADAVRFTRESE